MPRGDGREQQHVEGLAMRHARGLLWPRREDAGSLASSQRNGKAQRTLIISARRSWKLVTTPPLSVVATVTCVGASALLAKVLLPRTVNL